MSTGLFFVRRESTWITRRISSSRPMTGSSFPDSRERGQVAPVLLERLVRALGILRRNLLPASHPLERTEKRVPRDDVEREQEVLDGDELVAEGAHLVERRVEHAAEARGRLRLRRAARDGRQPHGGAPRPRRGASPLPVRHDRRASAEAPGRGARARDGRA